MNKKEYKLLNEFYDLMYEHAVHDIIEYLEESRLIGTVFKKGRNISDNIPTFYPSSTLKKAALASGITGLGIGSGGGGYISGKLGHKSGYKSGKESGEKTGYKSGYKSGKESAYVEAGRKAGFDEASLKLKAESLKNEIERLKRRGLIDRIRNTD